MIYGGYATGVPYCTTQKWPFIWLSNSNTLEMPMTIAGSALRTLGFQINTIFPSKTLRQQINTVQNTQRQRQQFTASVPSYKTIFNQINAYENSTTEIGYCKSFYGYAQATYPWLAIAANNALLFQLNVEPFTSPIIQQQLAVQIPNTGKTYEQFDTNIEQYKKLYQQFEQTNDTVYENINNINFQFDIAKSQIYHMEFRQMSYNLTQLRVLWEIGSDGISASNNYVASSNAGTGYEPVNLRSDFIERTWKSTNCVAEYFQFDVGVGNTIGIDTAAILGHNLTNGALITVYGYGDAFSNAPATDSDWYSLSAQFTMTVEPTYQNIFYVAAATASAKYRHWRVLIQDATNTDGFIEIGRFIAGEAMVFDTRENMSMNVDYAQVNYKDELKLNGFSSLANNRALRSRLKISFDNLDMESNDNYAQLQRYFSYCRDTLKALVIPDPRKLYRYTVYAKLSQMPQEKHSYLDDASSYASLEIELDEGK